MARRIPARLTTAEGRKFGLTVGIAFLALAGVAQWRGRQPASVVLAALGVVLVAGGLVVPTQLGPAQRVWMRLAHQLSRVTTPIFMGVVYFVVLAPIGLVMRLFGKNPLAVVGRDKSAWIVRERRKSDLRRQF